VINVGSSRPDRHKVLLCKHAEEFALRDIRRYMSKKKKKINQIRIIIWKQNNNGEIKSVNCCSWCKKSILKHDLNKSQIVTPCIENNEWNGKFMSATPIMKTLKKN